MCVFGKCLHIFYLWYLPNPIAISDKVFHGTTQFINIWKQFISPPVQTLKSQRSLVWILIISHLCMVISLCTQFQTQSPQIVTELGTGSDMSKSIQIQKFPTPGTRHMCRHHVSHTIRSQIKGFHKCKYYGLSIHIVFLSKTYNYLILFK